jgi:ABC-type nitrate/sulfonate/bicarbonate transport system substrate-binding protein
MPATTVLTIGGVPEHFNLPWHLAIEEGLFLDAGIDLQWIDCPGGTGEMTRGLAEGTLDLALPLSEGAVAAISRRVPMRILQWFVLSPLIWGVHVPAPSAIRSVDELRGRRFAISRSGSGSHLMAFVLARQKDWQLTDDLRFVEVGGLDGAIESFGRGESEAFLWERFTTQPYVDQGLMRRVGQCPTPWPAFVLAAGQSVLEKVPQALEAVMRVINETCVEFRARPGVVDLLAARYGLSTGQVTDWFGLTEWSTDSTMKSEQLQRIIDTLEQLGLLEHTVSPEDCCWPGSSNPD